MKHPNTKVFGIGLSKTGTTSLSAALQRLGYRVADFPWDDTTRSELERGEYQLSIMQYRDALTDIVASAFFAQYDRAFPGSKFVLTVRGKDDWLRSAEHHWDFDNLWSEQKLYPAFSRMSYYIRAAMYGSISFCKERYAWVYEQHELAVRAYFKDRPDDLLIMDVTKGAGYAELCAFLGVPVIDEPFPKSNSKSEHTTRQLWMNHFLAMVADIAAHIAEKEAITLIDNEPFANSTLTERWQVQPITDPSGQGGAPKNDADACAWLSHLTVRGDTPIVIPWCAFWWCDHYPDWFNQLKASMHCVSQSQYARIFINKRNAQH